MGQEETATGKKKTAAKVQAPAKKATASKTRGKPKGTKTSKKAANDKSSADAHNASLFAANNLTDAALEDPNNKGDSKNQGNQGDEQLIHLDEENEGDWESDLDIDGNLYLNISHSK